MSIRELGFAGALLLGGAPSIAETVKGPQVDNPAAGLAVPLFTPGKAPANTSTPRHFKSMPLKFGSAKIQLSGSNVKIDPAEWKAVAIGEPDGGEPCTLSLIGPATVLLAAHCVDAGSPAGTKPAAVASADVTFGTQVYAMYCTISDRYMTRAPNSAGAPRTSDDVALCDLDREVSGLDAEGLDLTTATPPSTRIRLMGFGCTHLGITDDGYYSYDPADKALRMGEQPVEATGISIYADQQGIYLRTKAVGATQPVLCFGDSGGPVMIVTPNGRRRIVGVNSAMGKVPDATHLTPAFYSYLSPLNSAGFKAFLKNWVDQADIPAIQRRARKVCGYNRAFGTGGCRT